MNGLNIYNVLRAMPINLATHNVGNIDSIGCSRLHCVAGSC